MALITVILLVLGTSVTAMFTVTAVAITPQKHLEQILPASTVMFVTMDLDPSQSTRDRLSHLQSSGWGGVLRPGLRALLDGKRTNACLRQTVSKARVVPQLGHDTALVVLAPSYRTAERLRAGAAGRSLLLTVLRNTVLILPLDIHLTLPEAVAGRSGLLSGALTAVHRGVRIYRQPVAACQEQSRLPERYYQADFEGYVLVALRLAPIETVIDTGRGARESLSSNRMVNGTLARRASGALGRYYINMNRSRQRIPGFSKLLGLSGATESRLGGFVDATAHSIRFRSLTRRQAAPSLAVLLGGLASLR